MLVFFWKKVTVYFYWKMVMRKDEALWIPDSTLQGDSRAS